MFEFNEEIAVGEVELPSPRDQIIIDSWGRGEVITVAVSGEHFAARFKALPESRGLDRPVPIPKRAKWAFNYVPFEHGVLDFSHFEIAEEQGVPYHR